jgi:hypothetical protein
MADRRAVGRREAAEPREDSRERLAEADSNWVSEEPWEQQPGEPLRPAWRLPAPEKSGVAVMRAVSRRRAPGVLRALQAQLEQPPDAQRVWQQRAAEQQQVPAWQQQEQRARVSPRPERAPLVSLRRELPQEA